jgi:hypothetical protein
MQILYPTARVTQGSWIEGPDGRRDRDVWIEGKIDSRPHRTLIECKDYNPQTTGPVGIEIVDALDSKMRDLGPDLGIICSNAGFTEGAVRKARRIGVILLGVFRESDNRIKYDLLELVYFRRLKIEYLGFRLDCVSANGTISANDSSATFDGLPVANWVCRRTVDTVMTNPISAGQYAGTYTFTSPVIFAIGDGTTFQATSLFAEFTLSGGWFEQLAAIDGTAGVYDYLRRRVRRGIDAQPNAIHFKNMDLTAGTPVAFPPRQELDVSADLRHGESWVQLLYLQDCNCREPVPPLDDLIMPDDLDLAVSNLPVELQADTLPSDCRQMEYFVSRNPIVGPDHSFSLSFGPDPN